jgi:hypothetical protein
VICLDDDWQMIAGERQSADVRAGLEHLACVIFIRLTGRPKGVEIENRSVVNFLFHAKRPGTGLLTVAGGHDRDVRYFGAGVVPAANRRRAGDYRLA